MAIHLTSTDSYIVQETPPNYRGLDNKIFDRFLTAYGIPIVSTPGVENLALQMSRWETLQLFQKCEWRMPALLDTNPFIVVVPGEDHGFWKANDTLNYIIVNEQELIDDNAERSICIHELAHLFHHSLDPWTKKAIEDAYENRVRTQKGYRETNVYEYWAESVTSYFDAQGTSSAPINNREMLETLDPDIYGTIRVIFGINDWRWKPVSERNVNFTDTPKQTGIHSL